MSKFRMQNRQKLSRKRLSMRMCNSLDHLGYGLFIRNEMKIIMKTDEYLQEFFLKQKQRITGGIAEWSNIHGKSDTDVMGVIGGAIVADTDCKGNDELISIKMERTGCFPCYCKLKFTSDQYDLFVKNKRKLKYHHYNMISKSVQDMYMSSKIFREYAIPRDLIPNDNGYFVIEFNGPAIRNINVDYVLSFEMQTWPEEAKIWKARKRPNNWPSLCLLNRLEKEIPCYVAPIGNRKSPEFDLEWRLSFVELERELIWSLNETQFKCYIFLKLLKYNTFSENRILEHITSYHLKNVLFWTCERLPESEWLPQNLLFCVKKCLKILEDCIRDNKLEHYFIPENNLFQNIDFKLESNDDTFRMLHGNINKITAKLALYTNLELYTLWEIGIYSTGFENIWTFCSHFYDPSLIDCYVEKFPEGKVQTPCIKIIQAVTKWQEELIRTDLCGSGLGHLDALIKTTVSMINEGRDMDFSQSTLNIAIVYFMHGLYDNTISELNTLFADKSKKVFASCLGAPKFLCFATGKMSDLTSEVKKVNVHNPTDRNSIVYEFCAEYNCNFILPYPFALQTCVSSKIDIFRYNPVIVAYYLLCMSYLKLGHLDKFKDAVLRFEHAVRFNVDRKDFYLSLVLLGHCLYWSGDIKAAYKCYAESMKVKLSVLNAAIYHIAFIVNNLCSETN